MTMILYYHSMYGVFYFCISGIGRGGEKGRIAHKCRLDWIEKAYHVVENQIIHNIVGRETWIV